MKERQNLVGQKIRRLRKERGMTQAALAAEVGVIQSDLCRMEKGEYRVGLETLLSILKVFRIDVGEFFGEEGRAAGASDVEGELIQRFRALSPTARTEVLDYLRFKSEQDAAPGAGRGTA